MQPLCIRCDVDIVEPLLNCAIPAMCLFWGVYVRSGEVTMQSAWHLCTLSTSDSTGADPIPHAEEIGGDPQVCDTCTYCRELSGKIPTGQPGFP